VIGAAVFETWRAIFRRASTSFPSASFVLSFRFLSKGALVDNVKPCYSSGRKRLSRYRDNAISLISPGCDVLDITVSATRGIILHFYYYIRALYTTEFIPAMHRHSSGNILAERVINATFSRSFAHSACLTHAPFSTCAGYIPPSYYCLARRLSSLVRRRHSLLQIVGKLSLSLSLSLSLFLILHCSRRIVYTSLGFNSRPLCRRPTRGFGRTWRNGNP